MLDGQNARGAEHRMGAFPGHHEKGALELARFTYLERLQGETQGRGGLLELLQDQHIRPINRIVEDRHARGLGGHLLEELQAFAAQLGTAARQSRDVPTRSREVGDESAAYCIGNDREDDGNRAGRPFGSQSWRRIGATMTSSFRRTSSAASSGSRSTCPAANRYSMAMF